MITNGNGVFQIDSTPLKLWLRIWRAEEQRYPSCVTLPPGTIHFPVMCFRPKGNCEEGSQWIPFLQVPNLLKTLLLVLLSLSSTSAYFTAVIEPRGPVMVRAHLLQGLFPVVTVH